MTKTDPKHLKRTNDRQHIKWFYVNSHRAEFNLCESIHFVDTNSTLGYLGGVAYAHTYFK